MLLSPRFEELRSELERLKDHLLPAKFEPTGDYSPDLLTKTIGYRVLAHAEVESYLEDKAWEVALWATKAFKEEQFTSKPLLALLAFAGQTMEAPPSAIAPDQPSQASIWPFKIKLSKKIDSALKAYHYAIVQNHGLKEENLLRLLLPIGVEISDIDQVWLASMNSFGEKRGEAAHVSANRYRIQKQIDPQDEQKNIEGVLEGLSCIDNILNSLMKK